MTAANGTIKKRELYGDKTRRPKALAPSFDTIPDEMRNAPRWVLWRLVWKKNRNKPGGKWTKVPFQTHGREASSTDPDTWTDLASVKRAYERGGFDGIGFVLGDDWAGVDLDEVRHGETLSDDATTLLREFRTYSEVSPSEIGVKMFCRGKWSGDWHRKDLNGGGEIEVYGDGRYFTVTGEAIGHVRVADAQQQLDALVERFKDKPSEKPQSETPKPTSLDDQKIIELASGAKNGAKFKALWDGDTSAYGDDPSRADLALCGMLAFYAGANNSSRVDGLFRQSKLFRAKWDEKRGKQTYGEMTVAEAYKGKTEFYTPRIKVTITGVGSTNNGTHDEQPAAGAASPPLPLLYYSDIAPALNTADFVEGLLIDGAMSVIYGESGCGKTFFALDLALHVAAGKTWRGLEVEQRGVLYLALEGSHGIKNRVAAFKAEHKANVADLPFAVVPVSLDLLHPVGDTDKVIATAKAAAAKLTMPVGLIVVDTFSRAMSGGNENAPEDMGAVVTNLDRIRQALPAHIATVHHSGKDSSRGARGHSLLRAATDTEIEVTRGQDGVSIAKVTKQRELDCDGVFAFRLQSVELGKDRRGKPVTSCVMREVDAPEQEAGLTKDEQAALNCLFDTITQSGYVGFPDVPSGVASIPEAAWRDSFYRTCKPGASTDARQKAYRRAVDGLVAAKRVSSWENRVWIPTRTNPDKPGHCPGRS